MSRVFAILVGVFTVTFSLGEAAATTLTASDFSQVTVGVEADILNTGTLVEARSLGTGTSSDTGGAKTSTINGVTFTAYGVSLGLGGSQIATSNLTTFENDGSTAWNWVSYTTFNALSGGGTGDTDIDDVYQGLAAVDPSGAGILRLSGLTSGNEYRLQWLTSAGQATDFNFLDSAGGTALQNVDKDAILNTRITFTADAATQDIFVGLGTAGPIGNGFALHDVTPTSAPEPSTFILTLLGIVGLTARRRRRARA